MALAVALAVRAGRRDGLAAGVVLDLAFWMLVAAIAGAWALHVIVNAPHYWRLCAGEGRCLAAFAPDTAGYVFFGGFVASVATLFGFARRRRLDGWRLADIAALAAPAGHALGRIGCWLGGCCYGAAAPPALARHFPGGLHPAPLYEAAALVTLFGALAALSRRRPFHGAVAVAYAFGYAALRFAVEIVRADPRGALGPLSTSQWISLAVAVAALFAWRALSATKPPPAAPADRDRARGRSGRS